MNAFCALLIEILLEPSKGNDSFDSNALFALAMAVAIAFGIGIGIGIGIGVHAAHLKATSSENNVFLAVNRDPPPYAAYFYTYARIRTRAKCKM